MKLRLHTPEKGTGVTMNHAAYGPIMSWSHTILASFDSNSEPGRYFRQ